MKYLTSQIMGFARSRDARQNLRILARYLVIVALMVVVYSVLFHVLMAMEGQSHSWLTGFYWTLTVMSTLGFGDITFQSDLGRFFSVFVLLSGVVVLLILLPFTFIEFFYAPWLEAQRQRRAPRTLPAGTHGHVLITDDEPVALALIERLRSHERAYYLIEPDLTRALELHDLGYQVVVGQHDDLETYRRARADEAAMIVATGDDYMNTNVAFTVRELDPYVPIVAFARSTDSYDVLELAGASHVLKLTEMLGQSLARRTVAGDIRANIIGRFGQLVIAEAPVAGTPMVGKTLGDGWLRNATGLTVVGLWRRGTFVVPRPDQPLEASTVLVLAGTVAQLEKFGELTAIYHLGEAPVVILGGGRVGRAAALALASRGIDYRIVEKDPSRVRIPGKTVVGSAADRDVLNAAGIESAPTAIVTTSDDATNIYLTIYCRKLRPDMQIISRSNLERNVSTLHRAGADFVMSYASMGANAVYNLLERDDLLMIAEGLDVFRTPVPPALMGKTLAESGIRETTSCSVVAIEHDDDVIVNPPPDTVLPAEEGTELILIGTTEGERQFFKTYGKPGDNEAK